MSRQKDCFRVLSWCFWSAECSGDLVACGLVDGIPNWGGETSRWTTRRKREEVDKPIVVCPSRTNPRSIFRGDGYRNDVVLAFGAFWSECRGLDRGH